jgi:hypothetical protein
MAINDYEIQSNSRLEAALKVKQRQTDDLYEIIGGIREALIRLRGEVPTTADEEKLSPPPCGILERLERELAREERAIIELRDMQAELRALI